VPSLRDPSSIRPEILPEYRVAFDWFERDPFCLSSATLAPTVAVAVIVALQKPTPRPRPRPVQLREIRPPTNTIRRQIHHKCTNSVPPPGRRTSPVEMMPIMPRRVVPLRPHALDIQVRTPALKSTRAVFDAAHRLVTGEQRAVGKADRRVDALGAAVVDYRGGVATDAVVVVRVLGMRANLRGEGVRT